MKPFSKEICDQTKDKELIVYGTGAVGEVVTQALLNWGRMPNLYCDHDPEKKVFFNRTVISPDRLKLHQNAVVILAFKDFLRSAVSFLRDAGIRECYSAESLILESFDDVVFSNNSKQIHEEWNQPPISTWWDSAGTDEDAVHEVKEQLGKLKFDYPKPSTLIERCIEICQNKSARVLDVFAGSGTTAVAVENANLKDNGRRSYTLIQRNELYQGINIADICYKRVQRTIIGSRIAQRCIVYTRSNDGTSDLLSR